MQQQESLWLQLLGISPLRTEPDGSCGRVAIRRTRAAANDCAPLAKKRVVSLERNSKDDSRYLFYPWKDSAPKLVAALRGRLCYVAIARDLAVALCLQAKADLPPSPPPSSTANPKKGEKKKKNKGGEIGLETSKLLQGM